MDHKLWQEEYRREVDDVLRSMRASKERGEPEDAAIANIIPPAGVYEELKAAKAQAEMLAGVIEEMKGRLEAQTQANKEEQRKRERLKDLIVKLNAHVMAVQTQARLEHQDAKETAARLDDALKRLSRADEAALNAVSGLETQTRLGAQRTAELRSLQGKVDELQLLLDGAERRAATYQARYEAAAKDAAEHMARREGLALDAARQIESLRENLRRAEGRLAGQEQERVHHEEEALAQKRRLDQERAGLEGRLEQALCDLAAIRGAFDAEGERSRGDNQRREEAEVRLKDAHRQADMERHAAQTQAEALLSERARLENELKDLRAEADALRSSSARARLDARKYEEDAAAHYLEESRRLAAQRLLLEERSAEAMRQAQAQRAEAEQVREQARLRHEEASAAILAAAQAKSRAAAAIARLQQERASILAELEEERVKLYADVDVRRAEAEDRAEARLQELRAKVKARWEADALGAGAREHLRQEKEEERRRILSETQAELERLKDPNT